MNVLVIGNGGREHALCWKLSQSKFLQKLFCAPGNAGTGLIAVNIPIETNDIDGLLDFAMKERIDLTVVGPEAPLALGIVDRFREIGLRIFGPTQSAARLETSKAFAKDFMKRNHIPTAEYRTFHSSQLDEARQYLRLARYPLVLKADGLASGKGVIITSGYDEAILNVTEMMSGKAFGTAGTTVVIEEYLQGIEASLFVLTDGVRFATLAPAQDHKRILDNDLGKNTGGMGAFAPTPFMPKEIVADVKIRIIKPVLDAMKKEGYPFSGVLFVGLMLTDDGPKVLEFNCRFGDPETQVVLPLINEDLLEVLASIADGKLQTNRLQMHDANAVGVVMASSGYPDHYEIGKRISGLDSINESEEGILVFHAGTKSEDGHIVTSGGRVLCVTALGQGNDFAGAIRLAYNAVNRIHFDGAYYRTDIGRKALGSLTS